MVVGYDYALVRKIFLKTLFYQHHKNMQCKSLVVFTASMHQILFVFVVVR